MPTRIFLNAPRPRSKELDLTRRGKGTEVDVEDDTDDDVVVVVVVVAVMVVGRDGGAFNTAPAARVCMVATGGVVDDGTDMYI